MDSGQNSVHDILSGAIGQTGDAQESICISTLLHAWMFGFVPVLWTHDVWWPGGAFLPIFFAVTWPALYRTYPEMPDQIHLHTSVVIIYWIGATLALCVAWSFKTPRLIDTSSFFSDERDCAKPKLSKTNFHILSVALLINAEYIAFQYYEEFFSFSSSLMIAGALLFLYLIINIGSYMIARYHKEYKENSGNLSLVCSILFTHVIGDTLIYLFPILKEWYGIFQFLFLLVVFYPVFLYKAKSHFTVDILIKESDKKKILKRKKRIQTLVLTTAIIHSFGYLITWTFDILDDQKQTKYVVFALFFNSFAVALCCMSIRIFISPKIKTRQK